MSRNYYAEIYLHLVWHTRESLPLLTPDVEALARHGLRQKLIETPGVYVHEIGGTETHTHLCISIAPTVLISGLVGALKGGSAYDVNRRLGRGRKVLEWQSGYGVVGFGAKDLPWVKAYVRDQRRRHESGAVHERLERAWFGSPSDEEKPPEGGFPTSGPESPVNGAPASSNQIDDREGPVDPA